MWKVTAISKLVNKCIEPFAIKIVKFIVCWLKKYPFCGIWGVKHCQKYDVWKKNQTIVALNVYFYLTDISASTSWLFHFGWEHSSDGREDACDQTQDEMCCSWEWARSNLKLKHPKGFYHASIAEKQIHQKTIRNHRVLQQWQKHCNQARHHYPLPCYCSETESKHSHQAQTGCVGT